MSPALVEVRSNSVGNEAMPVPSLYSAVRMALPWSVALDSWSARMMSTMDGGMIWPRVPEALMVPVAREWE